jgi:hypothetical protein
MGTVRRTERSITEGTMTIHADEIRVGDIVVYDGCPHRIARIERHEGWAWPVAVDGSGWGFAIDHQPVDVVLRAVA